MTFARLLSEATVGELPRTGDVLAVGLPLLVDVDALHRRDTVTGARGVAKVEYDGDRLHVRTSQPVSEQQNWPAIDTVAERGGRSGVEVSARFQQDLTGAAAGRITSLDVVDPDDGRPERPVLVRGYQVWEQLHGHHDELTDIAYVGLLLCSYAFGVDLESPEGIDTLALHHRHPSQLNPHLHPVVAGALVDMITPDRSRRPTQMAQVISRLEHYRDLPADLDLSAAYLPDTDWRRAVLGTLRDRVFDTTRRNRELYFRHTASSVSLTEASVPLMLNADRIRPDDILTWTDPSNRALRKGPVDLAKWCRFEETPYLAPALDKIISADRKMRAETGHSRLRLIIAFLHWHDPETEETVISPLLTLPAVLTRRKGVQTRYRLDVSDELATVNPVLRHLFATRFDIPLPSSTETTPEAIEELVDELQQNVRRSAPNVQIETINKQRLGLLRRKAQLRVDTYRRRRARTLASSGRWRRVEHSYDLDDWRPLGRELYTRFVLPEELPLRDLAGAPSRPRTQAMADEEPGERTSETYLLTGDDASADRWQVDLCSVTLAMLGSSRTNLARDYDEVLNGGAIDVTATPFEPLFRPEPSTAESDPTAPMNLRHGLVLPADDAQARAVQRASRGDSFIIQGPPGTGKSQTITNVIAALAAEGKRVLFVCEKRAAIDVVAHRLKQVGLDDLTATIHDSQLDRKDFVKGLGATYHRWLDADAVDGNGLDTDRASGDRVSEDRVNMDGGNVAARSEPTATRPAEARRDRLVVEIETVLRPLTTLAAELGRDLGGGVSVAAAIERVASIESRLGVTAAAETARADGDGLDVEANEWLTLRPGLERVHNALTGAGLGGALGDHPALRLQPTALAGVDGIDACRELGRSLGDTLSDLADENITVADAAGTRQWRDPLRSAANAGSLPALDPTTPQHLDFRAAAQRQDELAAEASAKASVLAHWSNPLSPADTAAGLELARAKEGSFLGFLNGRWRSLRSLVKASYAFDAHQVAPTITSVLEQLQAHHLAVAALEAQRQANTERYGTPDVAALRSLVDQAHDQPAFAALVTAGEDMDPLLKKLETVDRLSSKLLISPTTPIAALKPLANSLEGTPVAAEAALIAWADLAGAEPETLTQVLDAGVSLDEIEAQILRLELERWQAAVDHDSFSGPRVDDAVATVGELYRQLLDANAAVVVERVQTQFHRNIAHSEASMAGRSDQDKSRKKAYKAGRRIVEREAEKKMRHRSIREMAGGESGVVVRDLRPIWLMSPLSVSDTLPLEADLFDVVIFDEASQIPVEDAIPSVFRAAQLIVVGDRMQMPPTRFFSSGDDEDGELIIDEDGHPLSISLDSDSFLTQADMALDSSMLNWHYRSRYESLIAYSNYSFYGGRLATVPDTALGSGPQSELVAANAEDGASNAAEALRRPISYHHLEHGEYRDRRNVPEADYVAEMVRTVLRGDSGMTIGIVAFSEAQQGAIESSLEELATIDPEFAELYERELTRTDDDEFVGLFVKNLENVQGDERDLIIMSVCYGPDPNGRIRMNFGPINHAGGERRLNVIFSRAREHMAVVASLRGSQITNLHNEGAAHLAGFLNYAAAESCGETDVSAALLRSAAPRPGAASPAEQSPPVASALATALGERGWQADVAVGRSDFRIDVAIAVDGTYRLGVLLEPDHSFGDEPSPVARYVAEAGVLGAFGWPIVRVPVSDWLADPERVVERLDTAAGAAAGSDVAASRAGTDRGQTPWL